MPISKKVLALFTSNKIRHSVESINIDRYGILNDKYYHKNINRSILITSTESYKLIQKNKIQMQHGQLGENLLVNFNPYGLSLGTQIKVGDCILEITENCTLCNHLSKIDKKLPLLIKNNRGIFAKVIQGGQIQVSNTMHLID